MQQSSLGAGSLALVPVMRMQSVWPSRPCLGASDRTSSMCLQAAPRVKAEEANHPRSYSPKPLASRTEPIRVGRFGSTVSRLHSSCARNSGKGSVKSSKAVGFEEPECVYVCVRASVFVAESLCFEECMF